MTKETSEMSDKPFATGRCLCGAVDFTPKDVPNFDRMPP
jgi:hypothetical protein